MLKNAIIGMLLVAIVVLAMAVVRLESYHHASEAGMCTQSYARDPIAKMARHKCLHGGGARSVFGHLIHGVVPE